MAITFSKPDPSSPAAVGSAQFNVGRRGFEQGEVRDFLRMVSAELARLQERERFLESELRAMQTRGLSDPGVLDEATVTTLLGQETARVLTVAREAAQQMRARASETAEQIVRQATAEVARLREEVEIETSHRRKDTLAESEAELELAKQQGRDMVNEARAYREKLMTELGSRRELARQQIEELIRNRDRLMSAFERARLAASDVVVDLSEFDQTGDVVAQPTPTVQPVKHEGSVKPDNQQNVVQFDREKFDDEVISEQELQIVETPDEPEVEDIVPEIQSINPVETEPAVVDQEKGDTQLDNGHRAQVVQLFGRTARQLHPSTENQETVTPSPISAVDELFDRLRQASAESVAKSVTAPNKPTKPTNSKKVVNPAAQIKSTVADSVVFDKREHALEPLISSLSKKLKRVLADEENAMLNYLQTKKAQVALEKVLQTTDAQVLSFVEATSKDLIEAAMAGAKSISNSLKVDLRKKVSNTTVMQVMSKKLAEDIVYPLRERIQRCVEKSNGDLEEMSSLIRTVYREWKMLQIDKLVGDIARLAYSRGAYLVVQDGAKVCWVVDPSGPPCADAEDNSLAGAIACGEKFPTGHQHPVIHAGCKCLVVPAQS